MRMIDLITMSIRSLWRRKLRTALTILGVVIGTVSIVLMLSLGIAMDENMEAQFAEWGDLTLINIYSYEQDVEGVPQLTDEVIKELETLEHVERVVPKLNTFAYVTQGKMRSIYSMQMLVMNKEDIQALGYELTEGRLMEDNENKTVVIGQDVLAFMNKIGKTIKWENIDWGAEREAMPIALDSEKITLEVAEFDDKSKPCLEGPEGRIKAPKGIEVKVSGILESENNGLSETIIISKNIYNEFIDLQKDYQKKLGWGLEEEEKKDKNKEQTYNEVTVKVDHRDHVLEVVEAIKALGYSDVNNSMEYINRLKEQSKSKQMALGGIGIVSFIVAAIGIANTMMMSIYERTKEIGVMKVIGARLKDIKQMFLIEALMIGAIGGIIGVAISVALSLLMNMAGGPIAQMLGMGDVTTVSKVPLWLMSVATVFATLVGLLSGYFPARKAMKLSALAAIKTE